MKYYMYLIRILQLILHLPIFIIQSPGNVSMIMSILIPVANFDFHIDGLLGMIVSFTEEESAKIPFSYELIGYGNNAILNMGSIFVVNQFQNLLILALVMMVLFGLQREFQSFDTYLKFSVF